MRGFNVKPTSTYAIYYSEFNQEESAFIKVLTEQLVTRTKEQRKRPVGNLQKWSRSLTGAVAYDGV